MTKDDLFAAADEAYDVGYSEGHGEGWAEAWKLAADHYRRSRRSHWRWFR